jgi:hypothetical protein
MLSYTKDMETGRSGLLDFIQIQNKTMGQKE